MGLDLVPDQERHALLAGRDGNICGGARRGRPRRTLPPGRGPRRRRDGLGVSGPPPRDGSQGRGQAPQAAPDQRRDRARSVHRRGAPDDARRLAARGQGARLRRHRGPRLLHGPRVPRRPHRATRARGRRSVRARARAPHRTPHAGRARRRARDRPGPPRHQARQPAADAQRRRPGLHQGARLRRREADGGRAGVGAVEARAHPAGHGVRHARVHVARAGVRPADRRPQRPLLARRDDVRDADRLRPVLGQEPDRVARAPRAHTAAAPRRRRARARTARRARRAAPALPGEAPRAAPGDRRRDGGAGRRRRAIARAQGGGDDAEPRGAGVLVCHVHPPESSRRARTASPRRRPLEAAADQSPREALGYPEGSPRSPGFVEAPDRRRRRRCRGWSDRRTLRRWSPTPSTTSRRARHAAGSTSGSGSSRWSA